MWETCPECGSLEVYNVGTDQHEERIDLYECAECGWTGNSEQVDWVEEWLSSMDDPERNDTIFENPDNLE